MTVFSMCSRGCLTLLTFLSFCNVNLATTIIPPKDINELFQHSEFVVFGEVKAHHDDFGTINKFRVLESFKGAVNKNSTILIKEASTQTASEWLSVSGDVNFAIGEKYLLFLFKDGKGYYRPRLQALSVFQEIEKDGELILARTEKILDLCFMGDIDESLLGSYKSNQFRQQLKSNKIAYKKAGFKSFDYSTNRIQQIAVNKTSSCAIPAHCTTLIGDPFNLNTFCNISAGALSPAKYPSNTHLEIKVANTASDDPSTSLEFTYLEDAIQTLNNIDGISISLASPLVQDCNTTGCSEVATVTNNICNPNDLPVIWVYFDDPCDELADLSPSCNGIVGTGGTFAKIPCITDQCGNQWLEAKSSYIFLNSDAGCLSGYQYTALIIHELLHSYNLDHIGGSCTALMNGSLCNSDFVNNVPDFGIRNLDVECIEWMYNQCRDNEQINNTTFQGGNADQYFTVNEITTTDVIIESNADVRFEAGTFIQLNPEFEIEAGAIFNGLINGCTL